jgi:hypothetical protein
MTAAGWAQQPAAPPSAPTRRLVTPAARAFLRSHCESPSLDGGTGVSAVIHLAEAQALARAAAELREADSSPRALQDAWAGVDVLLPSAQDPTRRLARVVAAATAAMRRPATSPVCAVVRFPDPAAADSSTSVVLDDVGSLSVSGIERRLAAGGAVAGRGTSRAAVDAQLEVVDGSGLGVTRLLVAADGRVVVTIGAVTRRVMPHRQQDGQEVIAASPVVELWVHGGGTLGALETVRVANVVGWALATVDRL